MVTVPFVSVVVPCRNEEAYIASCLDSILANDYPADRVEILVADGMSDDRTREVLAHYAARHPAVILIDNPARSTPAALNAAIRVAAGNIIIRMDVHVTYPADYIRRLVAGLEETGADNVGGVIVTLPADDTPVAQAIALGLSHRFGVGNSYFRIGARERRSVDTVPFGCYRREVFQQIGLFDEELIRNQDDEFNFRLITRGGRILLLPDVVCRYFARASFRHLARMYYQYGYFKPLVARKVGRVMTVRQLMPALLLVTLVGAAALGLWLPAASVFGGGLLSAYGLFVLLCSAPAVRSHGFRCAFALMAVFPILHFSYGIGFLRGAFDHLVMKTVPRQSAITLSR